LDGTDGTFWGLKHVAVFVGVTRRKTKEKFKGGGKRSLEKKSLP